MLLQNSSYKKVRSISEGNFHSCYASNKAEKFKFRRLSQGLESCAQAQALKFRKEEKELLKLYQNIEKEKMKNEIERKHNQFYLQTHNQKENNLEQNSKHTVRSHGKLLPLKSRSNFKSWDELRKGSKTKAKKERRQSLPVKLSTSNEVIPFYMQHGYSHYHNDTHYDQLIDNKSNSNLQLTEEKTPEQPSWKHKSKLSQLKFRRNAITSINPDQVAFLRDVADQRQEVTSRSAVSSRLSNISDINFDDLGNSSMHVNYDWSGKSNRILQDVLNNKTSIEQFHQQNSHGNSVLTPFERQELAKYQFRSVRTVSPMDDHEKKAKHLFENSNRGRRHTLSLTNNSKLSILKHVLLKKLVKGESLKDLAADKAFDSLLDAIDDGRVYPAYDPDTELTIENFNALRKCKYLRISDLNKQSLTEVALGMLLVSDK